MSTPVILFGDSLREAAKPWLEELGKSDRDRMLRLLKLSITEKTRLSEALTQLFPGEDTQTALANLTRLRNRLNDAGEALGLSFKVDTQKKSPPTERSVWFTGPDAAVLRATRFSQQMTADIEGKPFIPSKGIATTGTAMEGKKIFVRFFVSYARANKELADNLVDELKSQFGCSKRYEVELWMDQDTTVGDRWHERIQAALHASDFGLLLVGPEFLNRKYIKEHELPHFMQDKKPILPVGLIKVDFQEQDLLGLEEHQIFRLPLKNDITRFYEEMSGTAKKREFAHQLFLAIQKRLDACFAPSPESDAGIPARSEDEETCEVQAGVPASPPDLQRYMPTPEETRHFQRTRGYMHQLSQRESIDPARVNLGEARDALDELEAWAVRAEGSPFFALLGEVGIGKTTTLKQFTRQLIEKRQKEPGKYPLPIYIDLRDYVGDKSETVPTIEELLSSVIQRSWRVTDRSVTAGDLLRLVREEGALIIFDGLDEKIVHLTQSRARDFIRTLWSVLPQAMLSPRGASLAASCKGKMLVSCRSHYFRDVWSQNAMLTGEDREGIDRSQYPAFCLLPFDEGQIRGYLTSFLGDEKRGGEAFELIASIHNLRDLAERPYLLSLISGRLGELEALQMRGETVNAARLYDLVVRSWLSRDDGKHHLDAMHKRRLMEALAAALWRSGEKQWDVDRLEEWFDEFLHQNPAIASAYANKDRSLLKEDLRTATFVLRPDTEAKHFRFAHTSLQEYFLASHLFRALADKADAEWDLPMVSVETLDFLGQILATNTSALSIASLERILGGDCLPAACLAFKYWLEAIEHSHPEPQPEQVNLAGADLEEWHIKGRSKDHPLNLRGADLRGVQLNRARVEFVDLSNADLSSLKARQALFIHVTARHVKLVTADFTGLQWRKGFLASTDYEETNLEYSELVHVDKGSDIKLQPVKKSFVISSHTARVFTGHQSGILSFDLNRSKTLLVSASEESFLCVWDARTGQHLHRLIGHNGIVTDCAWSLDEEYILSCSSDKTLRIWYASTGKCIITFIGHRDTINKCSWHPFAQKFASASSDKTLRIWDAVSGKELLCLLGHTDSIFDCAWSHCGRFIASGSSDGTVCIWDAENGQPVSTLSTHSKGVYHCEWSPSGDKILVAGFNQPITVWDVLSQQVVIQLPSHDMLNSCSWSPDGREIATAQPQQIAIWDATSGKELFKISGSRYVITTCKWSFLGSEVLTGGYDLSIHMWDIRGRRQKLIFEGLSLTVWSCNWSNNGHLLAFGTEFGITILGYIDKSISFNIPLEGFAHSCQWSPNDKFLLATCSDGIVYLIDTYMKKVKYQLQTSKNADSACRWHPSGLYYVVTSDDFTLKILEAETGNLISTLSGHADEVNDCAWSPDGLYLLSSSKDGTVRIWNTYTFEQNSVLCRASPVYSCAWSSDSRHIASMTKNGTLTVWDAFSTTKKIEIKGLSRRTRRIHWLKTNDRILVSEANSKFSVYHAFSGERLIELSGHLDFVSDADWSPDGTQILTASGDGSAKIWDSDSGICLRTYHLLPDGNSCVFSGDDKKILHATPEAWRWLGWEERDAKGRFIRRLPAEAFGPIPGMED